MQKEQFLWVKKEHLVFSNDTNVIVIHFDSWDAACILKQVVEVRSAAHGGVLGPTTMSRYC